MWTNIDQKFSTPPPSWRKQRSVPLPMSERKRMPTPVNNKGDDFHVIHKVPAGDSPYVKAKHIQLIDKDPSRAVSLFWAAINAGDRIDSALKDMAVVMKQLDRSDEAIEAIKSFRHLCPDSQDSLDNVLIELYKRSGRIEEETEMLQHKLKTIEEGVAFSGAKTKMARSQGKKIQITIEQERSRILGNLAWAYLRQNKYEIAEQYYRKALSLEVDRNKQCNLAICLMHMNRMTEAKSLLQAVRASAGNRQMDCSYAKSFERAAQMLTELESSSVLELTEHEEDNNQVTQRRLSSLPANGNSNFQVTSSVGGGQNHVSTFSISRSLAHGHDEETVLLNERDRTAYSNKYHENKNCFFGHGKGRSKCISSAPRETFSPHTTFVDNWKKGSYLENQCGRSGFASTMKENCAVSPGIGLSSKHQETYASPAAVRRNLEVLFTQPRSTTMEFSHEGWRKERLGPIRSSTINLSSERTVQTDNAVMFTQPRSSSSFGFNLKDQSRTKWGEKAVGSSIRKLTFEQAITAENVQQQTDATQNVKEEVLVSTRDKLEIGPQNLGIALPSVTSEEPMRSWREIDQVKDEAVEQPPSQPAVSEDWKSMCWKNDGFVQAKVALRQSDSQQILDGLEKMNMWGNGDNQKKLALEEGDSGTMLSTKPTMVVDNATGGFKTSTGDETLHQSVAKKPKSSQDCSKAKDKKSWADMVEEEEVGEEEILAERNLRDCLDDWNVEEEEFNDENLNSNVVYPNPCPQNHINYLSQKFEDSFDLKDGRLTSRNADFPSRNLTVRRSLCFDEHPKPESTSHFFSFPLPNKGLKFENQNSAPVKNQDDMSGKNINMMSRNRLQVFRDITPFPDSP